MNNDTNFGQIKDELYGFVEFDPYKAKCKSIAKAGIFLKVHAKYFSFSHEVNEILDNPACVKVSLDETRKRVLIRKTPDNTIHAIKVDRKGKYLSYPIMRCKMLVDKMKEMYGVDNIVFGHHIGRMADDTNGVIFTLEDTFK